MCALRVSVCVVCVCKKTGRDVGFSDGWREWAPSHSLW